MIDIGAGQGRHSFEMFRRGAEVIAFDMSESDMSEVAEMFDAMMAEGHVPAEAKARAAADARESDARRKAELARLLDEAA